MVYPHLPYIITEIFCIVFAASILVRLDRSIGSEHEIREFRNMIYAYFTMLLTDIFSRMFDDDIISFGNFGNRVIDCILVLSISFGCFFWYKYIDDRIHQSGHPRKYAGMIFSIPIVIICVLDVISAFNGMLVFTDSKGHYDTTPLFNIQAVVNYFYLLVPTVRSILRAVKTKSKLEKSEYFTYAAYMIAPLICGMLEDTFENTPLLALCIFMVLQMIFLMIQNMQIYNDALTNLNNRRRLNQFLEEILPKASDSHSIVVIMMDINRFKAVNDTFGHIEGDNALRTFAQILRQTAAKYNAFVSRYGGDEFCMVIDNCRLEPGKMTEEIRKTLNNPGNSILTGHDGYDLTVSMGSVVCRAPIYDQNAVFRKADMMLYEDKKAWHSNGRV